MATLRPGTPIGIFYVHTDHLNTPRRVTQPSGNQLRWTWEADPFGTATPNQNPASLGTFKYNLRFPGQIYDSHGGLMQNTFRDYDPAIGRYVESDPIGLGGGVNTYAYVAGNPLSFSDAKGLVRWTGLETGFALTAPVGAGAFFYELESECIDGRKAKVVVAAYGQTTGVGVFAPSGTASAVSLDDNRSSIDPYVLQGFFGRASASISTFGIGYGVTYLGMGGPLWSTVPPPARGVSAGGFAGVDIGLTHMWGSTTVLDVKRENCACEGR